jgi:hypothetical protein
MKNNAQLLALNQQSPSELKVSTRRAQESFRREEVGDGRLLKRLEKRIYDQAD